MLLGLGALVREWTDSGNAREWVDSAKKVQWKDAWKSHTYGYGSSSSSSSSSREGEDEDWVGGGSVIGRLDWGGSPSTTTGVRVGIVDDEEEGKEVWFVDESDDGDGDVNGKEGLAVQREEGGGVEQALRDMGVDLLLMDDAEDAVVVMPEGDADADAGANAEAAGDGDNEVGDGAEDAVQGTESESVEEQEPEHTHVGDQENEVVPEDVAKGDLLGAMEMEVWKK